MGRQAAELATIAMMAAWALNFIVVKAVTGSAFPPVGFAFLRFGLAALILLTLLRLVEGTIRLPLREVARLAGLGLIGFGLYQLLWTPALRSIPAGDSALLIATSPVMTVLLAAAIGTDRLTWPKAAGAALAFTGVAVVIAAGQGLELAGTLGGNLLTLAAAACWAVYTSFGAAVLRRHTPLRATTWAVVGGALGLAPLGLVELAGNDWSAVTAAAWAGFLYSAILPAGLSNVVVFAAIRRLGPARVSSLQFLVPAFAVVMGAAFLGEAIRIGQVVGGAIIVAGIALTRRPGRRSAKAAVEVAAP